MVARFIGVVVVALVASAPARAAESVNLRLFRDVQRQVLQYPHFTIFDSIHIQVDDGRVTLTGKVTMPNKRTDIGERVARLADVSAVDNQIEVLPVSQFDDQLRIQIARAIYGHYNFRPYASLANPPIHIVVENGRVTLEGVVNSNVDRMLARSIAGSFLAFHVQNNLQTEAEVREALNKL